MGVSWKFVGAIGVFLAGMALTGGALAEVKIVATIKPVHALVAQVMGATGTPDLLVGGTASPHTFIIKPSHMKTLSGADVVFRVSEAVEPFTIKMAKVLPKSVLIVTLQQAPGVVTLPQRLGGPFEPHEHEHDAHHADGGHGAHHDDDHDEDGVDGHVWLDPANAKAMLDQIAVVLGSKTPVHAAAYLANAARAKTRIDALAADLTRELAAVRGQPYVVFHDGYQYFEKRFGLNAVGSITVNPEIPPSGKRLSDLRAKIVRLGAKCVFGEPNFEGKVIATVIEGTGARTGSLDPEGASLPAGPDHYEALMRKLADGVTECLLRGK